MADPKLQGLAYAAEAIRDMKNRFDAIMVEMNNDNPSHDEIWKKASRGYSHCKLTLDGLKYTTDKITITIENGDINQIHGCPPNIEIKIDNKDRKHKQISEEPILIN